MKRYIIVVLTIIVFVVLGLILIPSGKSNDKKAKDTPIATVQKQLHEYANSPDSRVVYTEQGSVVGDDQFRAVRVTIARDYRRVEILDGYTKQVQKSQDFANTETAYDVFLRALEHAGYTNVVKKPPATDERGVCPVGRRFVYELTNGNSQLQRTWSASCSAKLGSFGGNTATVGRLFKSQVTGYDDFIRGIQLD